jgi:hypothetical protein
VAGNTQLTLAEAWNGTSWKVVKPANPAVTTASQLNGVSCVSATVCTAVGWFSNVGHAQMFAEAWDGTHWTIQSIANPTGGTNSILNSVSCTSATACTAVGNYFDGSHTVTVAERFDGGGWTAQSTANPSGFKSNTLSGVSCPAVNVCTAVGVFGGSVNSLRMFAERWNGTRWVDQDTATPPGTQPNHLQDVSCPTVTMCMAVGDVADNLGSGTVFADQYS